MVLERALRRTVRGDEEDAPRRARSTVTVGLAFVPRHVRVAIAGTQVAVVDAAAGSVSWPAARGGGVTVHATGPRGWVTYVGRLKVLLERR